MSSSEKMTLILLLQNPRIIWGRQRPEVIQAFLGQICFLVTLPTVIPFGPAAIFDTFPLEKKRNEFDPSILCH